jgi:hypothetical protein
LRSVFSKLFFGILLSLLPLSPAHGQTLPVQPAAKLLVNKLNDFRAAGPPMIPKPDLEPGIASDFGATSAASRRFLSKDGQGFWLTIITTGSDAAAYALLTNAKQSFEKSSVAQGQNAVRSDIGTESFARPDQILFVKGSAWIAVKPDDGRMGQPQPLIDISRAFAKTLDSGESCMRST